MTALNHEAVDIALSSIEPENNATSPKPRKKTMTSAFLKYFETAPDGKSRRCKFCGQNYSIATATGNLGRHLKSRHPEYDNTTEGFAVVCPAASEPCNNINPPVARKQPQHEPKSPKLDLSHINWLLLKWITSSSLSSETLDDKWLKDSFKLLNPSIQIWPGDKFRGALLEIFKSMQEDIRSTLDQVSSKVSITLEFWTSYEQIYYMGVSCHWIDDNWSFQKVLLDVCHIPYPCGGAEIYTALAKVLKIYNIENKVLSCTHDNSQSAMHACHLLKDDMDAHKLEPFCYLPCAAHALNLIIEDGLATTKALLSKAREFVLEMNSTQEISKDFLRLAAVYKEGSWKIPIDTSMRWSGHYQMLQLVCKASKSMEATTRNHEEELGGRMLLNLAEKNAISIVHNYLEPFYKTTNNICTEKSPTVGLVLFFMDHIIELIASCRESHLLPDWLKTASEDMAKKAFNYNNQVCNIFTFMTSILDPRIKCELIPENLNSKTNLDEARTHFIRNYSIHFSSMASLYGSSQENEDGGGSVSFAEEIARKKRRASMSSTSTDELSQYLSEAPAPIPTNVLEWWKLNSSRYPQLSMMARDYLAVQATSVDPKQLFSKEGDDVEKRRFCMSKESTRALLCVKSWSDSGFKLKYKRSEIDCDQIVDMAARNHTASGDKKLKTIHFT